ncbi:MAG: TIGR04211 family SH3 domain-containing protein [bacterium]
MKPFIVLTLLLLALPTAPVVAETRYVTDEFRVPLRKTPCGRCSILIGGLRAGTTLTLLDEKTPEGEREPWSQVQTRSGKIGWLQSQYLVSEQVGRVRIKAVETELAAAKTENERLSQQIAETNVRLEELELQLSGAQEAKSSSEQELKYIREVSSDAIALQNQNQELLKRNKMLQSEVDVLTATNEQLRGNNSRKWFLYGAIAVVLGAMLTLVVPRLRPRKRFTEWA